MSRRLKTPIVTTIVVLSNVLGNFLLSLGVKRQGPLLTFSPMVFLRVLLNPWVTSGTTLLILWLLSRMALLSWTDLSYVLPVTSIGYVLSALTGRFFLAEQVSWQRWMGTLLIVAGVVLVGRTSSSTTEVQP